MYGFVLSKSARTFVHGVPLIGIERIPACPAIVFHWRENLRLFFHGVAKQDYPPIAEFARTTRTRCFLRVATDSRTIQRFRALPRRLTVLI